MHDLHGPTRTLATPTTILTRSQLVFYHVLAPYQDNLAASARSKFSNKPIWSEPRWVKPCPSRIQGRSHKRAEADTINTAVFPIKEEHPIAAHSHLSSRFILFRNQGVGCVLLYHSVAFHESFVLYRRANRFNLNLSMDQPNRRKPWYIYRYFRRCLCSTWWEYKITS